MNTHYEVVIVGAGSAGLAALREVKKRTQDFLLVNDGPWGTTCARVGCMPSKVLIEAANAYHRRGAFEEFGIRGAGALSVDLPAVLRRVRIRHDQPGALVVLEDGRFAVSSSGLVAAGSPPQIRAFAVRRIERSETRSERAWWQEVAGAVA